jgi:hypothetical protein
MICCNQSTYSFFLKLRRKIVAEHFWGLQREKDAVGGTVPVQRNYSATPGGAVPGSGNGPLYQSEGFIEF